MWTGLLIVAVIGIAYLQNKGTLKGWLLIGVKAVIILALTLVMGGGFLDFVGAWAGTHALTIAYLNNKQGKQWDDDGDSLIGQTLKDFISTPMIGRILFWAELALFVFVALT